PREAHGKRNLEFHRPVKRVAFDPAVANLDTAERAHIAAGEGRAVALEGQDRLLRAHWGTGDAIPLPVDIRHHLPPFAAISTVMVSIGMPNCSSCGRTILASPTTTHSIFE